EPTIGLDRSAQRAIREFRLKSRADHRPAMILTSHYMEDIEALCERLLIIREGEIVFDGGLDAVVANFADRKLVTAHLRQGEPIPVTNGQLAELGDVHEASDQVVRVSVPRAQCARAAALILEIYPVADLTIEEPEIGTIIERIMRARVEGSP